MAQGIVRTALAAIHSAKAADGCFQPKNTAAPETIGQLAAR
jgi:hypothetical protein